MSPGRILPEQSETATQQHQGWLAALAQVTDQPQQEHQNLRSMEPDPGDVDPLGLAAADQLGGEDALGDDDPTLTRRRVGEVGQPQHVRTHAPAGADVVHGNGHLTDGEQRTDRGHGRVAVPGRRIVPVDDAVSPRQVGSVEVAVELVQAKPRQAGFPGQVRLATAGRAREQDQGRPAAHGQPSPSVEAISWRNAANRTAARVRAAGTSADSATVARTSR